MNQKEKFEIWDATHPEIREVRAYLDRLCGKTPLSLVFRNGNDLIVTDRINRKRLSMLIGILLDNTTILHTRAFTYKDAEPFLEANAGEVDTQMICDWVSKNMAEFSDAHPAYEADIKLLNKHLDLLNITLEILDYHGIKLPKKESNIWLKPEPKATCCRYSDGEGRLNYYLEYFFDILIFSTYQ